MDSRSRLKEIGYQGIRRGDLVIHAMDAFAGAIGVAESDGKGTPVYSVCKPGPWANSHYYAYAVREMARSQWIQALAKGIRERSTDFRYDEFASQPVPLPPLSEQAAIVRFLDHADRRIRRYIRAKQKLVKLLEEQKQAIIHRAVTRGLNPNVRLKPSAVEWLGDVPAHWEVVRLKELATAVEQGWSPQCDAQPANDEEWGVLKVGCVNGDEFDPRQNKRLPPTLEVRPDLEIRDGDILVSRANTRELLGLAAVAIDPRPKLLLCDKLFRFRANLEKADEQFLVHAIRQQTSRAQIESSTNGASDSMQNIGQQVIRDLQLSLPPVEEQRQIVGSLSSQTSAIVGAVFKARREIGLLREYRTRLIADVVTGKLDVREAATRLPDEVDEPEPLDEIEAEGGTENADADDGDGMAEEAA